jgi:hypothetical protein
MYQCACCRDLTHRSVAAVTAPNELGIPTRSTRTGLEGLVFNSAQLHSYHRTYSHLFFSSEITPKSKTIDTRGQDGGVVIPPTLTSD